jgi:hypothetical protein
MKVLELYTTRYSMRLNRELWTECTACYGLRDLEAQRRAVNRQQEVLISDNFVNSSRYWEVL